MKLTARILLRFGMVALLAVVPALHGQVRSSANYATVAETQDGGGDLASSANYSVEGSLETVTVGDSTASTLVLEHGFLTTGVVVDSGTLVPPEVVSVAATSSGPFVDSVTFDVIFSEEVTGFDDASDLVIVHNGTSHSTVTITGSGVSYVVELGGVTGLGFLTLKVNTASDIRDLTGVPLAGTLTSDPLVFPVRGSIRWQNAGAGPWLESANWDLGRVPTVTDDVFINNGGQSVLPTDGSTVVVAGLNVGTAGGSGTLIRNTSVIGSALTVASITIGADGGNGNVKIDQRDDITVSGDLDIGVDGGTGSMIIDRGDLQLSRGLNIGVSRTGTLPSVGYLRSRGVASGAGSSILNVGRSWSAAPAEGSYVPLASFDFLEAFIGRVDDAGNATGILSLGGSTNLANLQQSNLFVGWNGGAGIATGTLRVDGPVRVSQVGEIRVGTSTPESTGNTVARMELGSNLLTAATLVVGDHQGSGSMDARVEFGIEGTLSGTADRNYGAVAVDSAVLNGAITAVFRHVPSAGTHVYELLTTIQPDGITGTPSFTVSNLNRGFSVDSFGVAVDGGVEKVILQISGSPLGSDWINPGTDATAGDWFTAANWDSNRVPDASESATVNNGGEALIDGAVSGGNPAEAMTLNIGTDEQSGVVTIDGEALDVVGSLAVGTSRLASPAGGTSSGTLHLRNGASLDVSPLAERSEFHLGSVLDASAATTASGTLSAIDSTLDFGKTLSLGQVLTSDGSDPLAPAGIAASFLLDNSIANFGLTDDLRTGVNPSAGGTRNLTVSMTNGSRLELDDLEFEGQRLNAPSGSAADTLTLEIRDSALVADGVQFGSFLGTFSPGATSELVAHGEIVDSTVEMSWGLTAAQDNDALGANSSQSTTLDLRIAGSQVSTEFGQFAGGGTSGAEDANNQIRASLSLEDGSSLTTRQELAVVSSNRATAGGGMDSECVFTLSSSSLAVGEALELGRRSSASDVGSHLRNVLTLSATDSALSIGQEALLAAGFVSASGGGVVENDVTLNLLRSSLAVGTFASIGELAFPDNVPTSSFSRGTVNLTSSWMTVGTDLQTALDQGEAILGLDRGYLGVTGNMTVGAGTTVTMNLAGATRATAANALAGGSLYSGIDVGGNLALNGGDLVITVENGPLTEWAYVLINHDTRTGTFDTVQDMPAGYEIDYDYDGGTAIALVRNSPIITLAGDAVMTLYAGTDAYSEPGATASDLVDGSLSVVIGGDAVDPATPGTYVVTYDATDSDGFAAEQVTRTVYVTRPVYFVDADAPDGGDGASWATAFNKLPDALDLTAPRTKEYYGKDQDVWVAAGTYYPDEGAGQSDDDRASTFLVKTGVSLYGGFSGTETAPGQRDPDANLTILSGDIDQDDTGSPGAGNAYHVVTMLDPAIYTANKGQIGVDTEVDGFTITGGKADGAAPHDTGGGVLVTGTVSDDGIVRDCRIGGNEAGNGAGVGAVGPSALAIKNCEIRDNHAALDGGGVYVRETGQRFRFQLVRLESNTATRGGGLYYNALTLGTIVDVEYCHVRGNHASASGGGIHLGQATLRLDVSEVSGNACDGNGGGIFAEEAAIELNLGTFAGNRALGQGGALYGPQVATVLDSSGQPVDPVILMNSLIWGNEDQDGSGAPGASVAGAVVGNISYTTSLVEGFAPGGNNLDGTLAANDPSFVAPEATANAPTLAGDYHLRASSPVISTVPNPPLSLDLDLVPRGTPADMGAYEYVSAYAVWAAAKGLESGINDDPLDDPDKDGNPNAKEFALDGDPLSGASDGKKRRGLLEVEGTDYFSITIPVRNGAVFSGMPIPGATVDGITYAIEGSSDLNDWTLPVTEVTPSDSDGLPALNLGWEYHTFILDAGPITNGFLRAALTLNF